MRTRRSASGFSLLELLVVVALVIILFTLYWGGGNQGWQKRRMAECGKNLQNIYAALKSHAIDNNGNFPLLSGATTSEAVLSLLVPRSTTTTEFFTCPGSKDKILPDAQPFANRKISYAYYMGHTANDGADQPLVSDRQVDTNSKAAGQLVFSSNGRKPGNNHDEFGGNVLFCDGSVRSTPARAAFNLTISTNIVLLNPKP